MNTFYSHILIQNTLAEYEIYQKGDKYKAQLLMNRLSSNLPVELSFWKEGGRWTSNHILNEHVLYQFGYTIDNHLLFSSLQQLKPCEAAAA